MRQLEEGRFLRHAPCETCGSSDAKAIYSNGTAYCFSCETYYPSVDSDTGVSFRRKGGRTVTDLLDRIEYRSLEKRRITVDTCRKFGYGYSSHKGKKVQVAPYYLNGELVAQHLRDAEKNFTWLGNPKNVQLFGQHLWGSGGKRVVVTEGEIDCLSVAQAFNLKWPVVSVPNGAQSAKKYIQQNIEWLESFDEIVLAFDNDEPGRKAAQECAMILAPGRVKIANWAPYKDANEMLQQDGPGAVAQVIFQAQMYRPDGIVPASELSLEYLLKDEEVSSFSLPYPQLNSMLRGLRKGELTTLTAGSGIGKSTLAREIGYHLVTQHGLKLGVVALEESVKKTALGFMALELNVPMGDLFLDRSIVPTKDFKDVYDKLIASDKLYFYDHFGSLESENLLSKLRYLATGIGVDFIILDHISIVVSGIEDGDERRIIDNLMTNLRSLVENTGVGMVLISHLKIPEGKPHEEGGRVTLNQLRGSGAIKQLSDNIIGIERDQQGEDPNVAQIRVLKNRLFGHVGLADTIRYHKDTGRLLPDPEDSEFNDAPDDVDEQPDSEDLPF